MRLLGIDPGTARMGYGILDQTGSKVAAVAWGVVETPKGPLPGRLVTLARELRALIARYQPERAAVEQLFFGHNSPTAFAVSQARGVALLVLAEHGCPILEVTPVQVKQAVSGYGRADKRQVQLMVARILGLAEVPKPDDAADALAIAWTGLGHIELQGLGEPESSARAPRTVTGKAQV